jgi:hypothetical protein
MLKGFTWHANHRDQPGASLFTARLAQVLIGVLDETSALGRRVLDWPGNPHDDAVALRVFAALHALARTGAVVELSAVYPPGQPSDEQLEVAVRAAISDADPFLARYLDSPPQTNEVGRSGVILGAALILARRFGHPLRLYEIGSSAGLNLRMADYAYDLGNARRWGSPLASVTVHSEWRGNLPPLDAPLRVERAAGCDVAPLDPRDDTDAARLVSYVWADQFDRLERIEAALWPARGDDIAVERADAADWIERLCAEPAPPGVARLVFHSLVWSYLPQQTRDRIVAALEAAGARATAESPLGWLRFENDFLPDKPSARLDMRVWPDGADTMLGRAQYHGRWVEWA